MFCQKFLGTICWKLLVVVEFSLVFRVWKWGLPFAPFTSRSCLHFSNGSSVSLASLLSPTQSIFCLFRTNVIHSGLSNFFYFCPSQLCHVVLPNHARAIPLYLRVVGNKMENFSQGVLRTLSTTLMLWFGELTQLFWPWTNCFCLFLC